MKTVDLIMWMAILVPLVVAAAVAFGVTLRTQKWFRALAVAPVCAAVACGIVSLVSWTIAAVLVGVAQGPNMGMGTGPGPLGILVLSAIHAAIGLLIGFSVALFTVAVRWLKRPALEPPVA